jgi:hypothetical protein
MGKTTKTKNKKQNKKTSDRANAREVDGGVHDAKPVSSNRVCDVPNVDRVEVLVGRRLLDKNLVVEIVQVLCNKHVNVAHDLKHVEALLERLRREVNILHLQPVLLLGKIPHLAVPGCITCV